MTDTTREPGVKNKLTLYFKEILKMRFMMKNYTSFCCGVLTALALCLFFSGRVTWVDVAVRELESAQGLSRDGQSGTELERNKTTSSPKPFCHPRRQNIICIKVHKAASSTTAAILERYGWRHNLTLAVAPDRQYGPHILSSQGRFRPNMVLQPQRTYNMLTNHVRYNREQMNVVIPNATYMTIIRHPVKHFESAFGYFAVQKIVAKNVSHAEDPIAAFMENPDYYWSLKFYFWFQLKSGQIFDLGLDHIDQTGSKVAKAIQQFDKEFDLVMIADYFDESLLLLRKHLCLDWNDIVYIPDNFRATTKKKEMSAEVREKIKVWNWADMVLYEHFNRTFWQKISDYGPDFKQDLQYFKNLVVSTRKQCCKDEIKRKPGDAHGVMGYVLQENATDFCRDLMLGDNDYTRMFRDRQTETLYNLPKNW